MLCANRDCTSSIYRSHVCKDFRLRGRHLTAIHRAKLGLALNKLRDSVEVLSPIAEYGLSGSNTTAEAAIQALLIAQNRTHHATTMISALSIVCFIWHTLISLLTIPLLWTTIVKLRILLSKPPDHQLSSTGNKLSIANSVQQRAKICRQLSIYLFASLFNFAFAIGLLVLLALCFNGRLYLQAIQHGFPILVIVTLLPLLLFQLFTNLRPQFSRSKQEKAPLAVPFNVVLTTEVAIKEDVDVEFVGEEEEDKRCGKITPPAGLQFTAVSYWEGFPGCPRGSEIQVAVARA